MAGREHVSLKTKLAAAICELFEIPYEHALLMHEDQVLSLVQWDHYPHRRVEGLKNGMTVKEVDHHSNLMPKLIRGHRKKTAEVDQPEIAKNKRTAEKHAKHRDKIAAKGTPPPADPRRAKFEFMKAMKVENVGEDMMAFPKNRSRSLTAKKKGKFR